MGHPFLEKNYLACVHNAGWQGVEGTLEPCTGHGVVQASTAHQE